ncbi:hypothetical protein CRM22_006637 [Opisthorchis felineus]|uniref:Uncharacterized protein n=1 Tax=Opisthorchis felineus TaxID=147828 RepID=A0A4S2LJY4_OPIFE|nr:hypothetical protein CRM22_006637 [Opisthorchis felineus]
MNVRALGLRIVGKHAAAALPVPHHDQMSNMGHYMPTGVLSIGIEGLGRVQFRMLVIVDRVLALILLYTKMKALLLIGRLHKVLFIRPNVLNVYLLLHPKRLQSIPFKFRFFSPEVIGRVGTGKMQLTLFYTYFAVW